MLSIIEDITRLLNTVSFRRSTAFVVGGVGASMEWAVLTDNLRAGPPMVVGILAGVAIVCGFTALFIPERLAAYISLLAAGVAALLVAVGIGLYT